ncbi:hypothetical protein IHE55_02275 [Streptomyces pactum]|uniref:Uncharacterized protein n=1 Tax=Streptomyces pactum TaxID=68249 RepID=A0ABS0NER6_9ACTN|nr:hypothetical protein [Streptomyces pactum]MBH5333690.1 hypothetical protein [Streptomyces pactum]
MNTKLSSARVGVSVRGDREDAYRVFGALKAVFPATDDSAAGKAAEATPEPGHGHMVWSMVVDTTDRGSATSQPPLSEPVSVDLYGTDPPVHRVCEALDASFGIEKEQHVSGDQEMEVRLRLAAPHP